MHSTVRSGVNDDMIIFNLWAIPVGLLIAGVTAGLTWLSPGLFGGAHEDLTIAGAAIVVGVLAEIVGMKARLFFMPIWLLGAAFGTYQTYSLFGAAGLVLGAVVLVGLLAAFLGMALASSRADLAQISERLDEARQARANGEFDAGREALRAAWVLPFFTKLTADHAQKLVPVIALIEAERAALGVDPQWTAVVAEARRLLELTGANGPYGFLSDELEVLNAVDSWLGDAEKAPDEDVLKKIAAGSAPAR